MQQHYSTYTICLEMSSFWLLAGVLNMVKTDLNSNTIAVFAAWLRLLRVHLKAARKNSFPSVKKELSGCYGCKKCGGQRAQIQNVRGTCPPHTPPPLHPWAKRTII